MDNSLQTERPKSGELTVLVHLQMRENQEDLAELKELALSAGAQPLFTLTANRSFPNPRYFIGSGKLDELKELVDEHNIQLVIFNHVLSPVQERNLEQVLKVRVLDRNELILDIFAQRARSFEGKLQVELAQLKHLSTRLIRGWTHLERQKGGIGMRGPGETQLETDRRLIGDRIRQIQTKLEKVNRQRSQGRKARQRNSVPTVALVGYTNAGKSTLFNTLTNAQVYAKDQLFATLDPTVRRVELDDGLTMGVADTVGFIKHLPHELVVAFKSTLLEAREADLLLHVIDVSSEHRDEMIEQVDEVLTEIGAADIPQCLVYNKIDLSETHQARLEMNESGKPAAIWLSAQTGEGMPLLEEALSSFFQQEQLQKAFHLTTLQAGLRSRIYDHCEILQEDVDDEGGWQMTIRINKRDLGLLEGLKVTNQG